MNEFLQLIHDWACMDIRHVYFLLQAPRMLVARLADMVMAADSPVTTDLAEVLPPVASVMSDAEPTAVSRKRAPTLSAALDGWQTASNSARVSGVVCLQAMHVPQVQPALETIALLVRHCGTSHDTEGTAEAMDAESPTILHPPSLLAVSQDCTPPMLDETSRRCICHSSL